MADSAPEFAVEALTQAIQGRNAAAVAVRRAGADGSADLGPGDAGAAAAGAAAGFKIPALHFTFSAPSFLSNRSRWVLFILLIGVGVLALWFAWDMAKTTSTDGPEWVAPPLLSLIVAAVALAFAYAAVMGFGNVELSTTIGEAEGETAAGLTVTNTVPEDKKKDVAVDSEVEVMFSEAIDPASLTDQSLLLRKATDKTLVAGAVSTDADGMTGRLKPAANLDANTDYEVEVTTAVKTAKGTALKAAKTITFTTAT